MSLDEMKSVADDALENQRTVKHQQHFKGIKDKVIGHLSECQQSNQRHLSEVQHEVRVQQVASTKEVEHLRHELSQSFAEGSHYQNLFTTSRSGASESSSEIQHLRHERDHLNFYGRNLETANTGVSQQGSFS